MAYEVGSAYPTRRRSPLRTTLLTAVVVLIVCCIGAAGLGAWNFQILRGTSGPVRAAADAFLRDVAGGDAAGAYGRLCPATRDRWTREEFVRQATGPDGVLRYSIDNVKVATKDGHPQGAVSVKLVRRTGAVDTRTLVVVRDGDTWRVCGDTPI